MLVRELVLSSEPVVFLKLWQQSENHMLQVSLLCGNFCHCSNNQNGFQGPLRKENAENQKRRETTGSLPKRPLQKTQQVTATAVALLHR